MRIDETAIKLGENEIVLTTFGVSLQRQYVTIEDG